MYADQGFFCIVPLDAAYFMVYIITLFGLQRSLLRRRFFLLLHLQAACNNGNFRYNAFVRIWHRARIPHARRCIPNNKSISRSNVITELYGDDTLIHIHIIPYKLRARDITPEMQSRLWSVKIWRVTIGRRSILLKVIENM